MKKLQLFISLAFSSTMLMVNPVLTHAEEVSEFPKVDLQGDYVSFDDVTVALKGSIQNLEEGREYKVQEKTFVLSPSKGYSQVNQLPEPYLLETSKSDSSVLNVMLVNPISFNEELFVPIEYVTRLLDLTFEEGAFKADGNVVFEGEDFVTIPEEQPEEESGDESTEDSESTPEEKPTETPDQAPDKKPEQTPSTGNNSGTNAGNSNAGSGNNGNSGNSGSSNGSGNSNKPTTPSQPQTVTSVYVNQSSVKLEVGQSTKVNAVVNPFDVKDTSIKWSSSNHGVATVDGNGTITAKAAGTATITATSNMNPNAKATVTVTVTPPPVINASSVSVDKTSVTLEVGGSTKVSAWVSPDNTTNKGINWSSENSSVATVDGNGNITAKGAGTTRIVATAASNGSAKAYINVTVNAPKPPAQPTYTGSSVISQLKAEGWYTVSNIEVYFHEDGDGWSASEYQVYVAGYAGTSGSGLDVRVQVRNNSSAVFGKTQQALSKIIPSGASTIVGYLQTPGYSGGTYTFDGRTVKVYFSRGLAYVDVYGKQ